MGGYYHPHILCALCTGMRIVEIKALKWKDIDFEKRQIEVRRSSRRGRITGTKTGKRRRVDMTPPLNRVLKRIKNHTREAFT
jgi:integrase